MFAIENNSETKITIFVEYPIIAVTRNIEDALTQYLLDFVWGERRRADEDIRLTNNYGDPKGELNVVRYQFGEIYEAEESMDEIRELIQQAFDRWDHYKHRYEK